MTDIEIPLGKRTPKYRFFEMLPAFLSYGLVLLPVVLSFINPLFAAVFIIGFLIMFFVKAIGIAYRTIQGYNSLERARKIDWLERLNDLEDPKTSLETHQRNSQGWGMSQHKEALARLVDDPKLFFKPSEAFNAVIIATYNESREVLLPTLEALFASNYNTDRLILILAYEERGPKETRDLAEELAKRFADKCYFAVAVKHPDGLPNQVRGKGGNISYAGNFLKGFLSREGIDPEKVLVTTLDSDNRPHPQYLAYAMYAYIIDPHRERRAYQPIALYLNNIWDVPAPMRVLATGNSFWTIINSMRPHMLRNFAAHSQGMSSLIKTDFWSVRTIVEDGHQYWRSYFTFDGDYEVTPVYVPIYQDAVLAETYKKTMKAQFLQLGRWAYGASDIAYVANVGLRKESKISAWNFWPRFLRLIDSHVSWASAPLIITFGAWAPLIINPEANRSIIAHELPQIASQLQFLAMFGLFITIYLTFKMLPPRPARYKRRRTLLMVAQWLIMPLVSIGYGASAAFYSQTRLLLGKYLDKFDVTVKAVKK